MRVSVHEDGSLRIEGRGAPVTQHQRVIDHRPFARPAEFVPRLGDVPGEPPRLLIAGAQTVVHGDRPPERPQRRRDGFEDLADVQSQVGEVGTETLEQHRRRSRIVGEELGASSSGGEPMGANAATERVAVAHVQRHRHLQHARPARGVRRGDHVARGAPGERRRQDESPTFREFGDHCRKVVEPSLPRRAVSRCALHHEFRHVQFAHTGCCSRAGTSATHTIPEVSSRSPG